MTWYAHRIYVEPTQEVVKLLKREFPLTDHLYLVKHLSDHSWPTSEYVHGLPELGLLVVREITDPRGSGADWHGEDLVSYESLTAPAEVQLEVPPNDLVDKFGIDRALIPMEDFLRFLKHLSHQSTSTVVYYQGSTWGGLTEDEVAWVFGESELIYMLRDNPSGPEPGSDDTRIVFEYAGGKERKVKDGDVVCCAMKHLGLELPTPYFALHTRGFPWSWFRMT